MQYELRRVGGIGRLEKHISTDTESCGGSWMSGNKIKIIFIIRIFHEFRTDLVPEFNPIAQFNNLYFSH
jgi:hypothetical protein